MDLFVKPNEAQYPDGSEKAVKNLFRTGRPLWGGIIELRNSVKGARLLAISKTCMGWRVLAQSHGTLILSPQPLYFQQCLG